MTSTSLPESRAGPKHKKEDRGPLVALIGSLLTCEFNPL